MVGRRSDFPEWSFSPDEERRGRLLHGVCERRAGDLLDALMGIISHGDPKDESELSDAIRDGACLLGEMRDEVRESMKGEEDE